jgi:hypothetical protein
VDFLVEDAGRLTPVEAKLASTPRPDLADGVARARALLGGRMGPGLVVTLGGDQEFPLTREDTAVPFASFARGVPLP